MNDGPPPSWYEPPAEHWGRCPECGASQEDAERLWSTDRWRCPCGHKYSDEEARYDPRDDEPADLDEWREENDR